VSEDLIVWLRGVFDEDEALANAAQMMFPRGVVIGYTAGPDVEAFLACHDPAAVLADIAAKRAILGDENEGAAVYAVHERGYWPPELTKWADEVIRLLASAYADRAGYRPEWRPA
jgi:hypothetical protein